MTMYPVVPDLGEVPGHRAEPQGHLRRDRPGGHWIKLLLHYMFIYKAKARPGWHLIPE